MLGKGWGVTTSGLSSRVRNDVILLPLTPIQHHMVLPLLPPYQR